MKVEKINESVEEIRLHVVADADDMTRAFADGLDVFVTQYHLEDAEGDTPQEKIASAIGEEDAQAATYSAVVNYLVPFALEAYGVLPLATYGIESDDTPEPGKPFSFDMTVLAKPEFELTDYGTVSVAVDPRPEVSESDIDDQIALLARHFAAAQQNKEPNDDSIVVPLVNDAWVSQNLQPMGVSTVAELRDRVRRTSEEELETRYEQAKMAAAMEEYANRFGGKVSKTMLAAMTQELYETFLAELASSGMTFEQFTQEQNMTEDDVRATLEQQAGNQLVQGFILDAIFRHEGLQLETSDLMAALRNMAPGREDETFDAMQKSGRSFLLKEAAARMKAGNWILENVEFTEK